MAIRVVIVDDSALVRNILSKGLSMDAEIEVVGLASDPFQARTLVKSLNPDVLTLDVEMPRMDGVEFLRRMMPVHPMPVLMVSSLTQRGAKITMDALDAGAVDFVTKPTSDISRGLNKMLRELRKKVKAVAKANVKKTVPLTREAISRKRLHSTLSLEESTDKVIAIGASTGGTEAIREVVTRFPADMPGVVIVQHMPPGFTKLFSERLNSLCAMDVKEAEDGDRIMPGRILVAPGAHQMSVVRTGGIYRVKCYKGELVNGHMPSVAVLFDSVAKYVGNNAVGAMLTGMGKDGALAMLEMRNSGARTMAQNKETSVVFGMPMEAYKCGGAEKLVPIDRIASEITKFLKSESDM